MKCEVTYDELAQFVAGELGGARSAEVREHAESCEVCRLRIEALEATDRALRALPRLEPPVRIILQTRRLLSERVRGGAAPEILTLEEVAEFLRISLDDLEEVVLELPVFELAGQLRVRRTKLLEWVQARERAYAQSSAESEVARILSATQGKE